MNFIQFFKLGEKYRFTGDSIRKQTILKFIGNSNIHDKRKTKTGIAKEIAEINQTTWQNTYSSVYQDIAYLHEKGIIKVGGRFDIRRGPKAVQREGIPFYTLTEKGNELLTLLSTLENIRLQFREAESIFNSLIIEIELLVKKKNKISLSTEPILYQDKDASLKVKWKKFKNNVDVIQQRTEFQ